MLASFLLLIEQSEGVLEGASSRSYAIVFAFSVLATPVTEYLMCQSGLHVFARQASKRNRHLPHENGPVLEGCILSVLTYRAQHCKLSAHQ